MIHGSTLLHGLYYYSLVVKFLKRDLCIYLRQRERERKKEREGEGAEGEGERESEAGSMLSAEPNVDLNLMILRS